MNTRTTLWIWLFASWQSCHAFYPSLKHQPLEMSLRLASTQQPASEINLALISVLKKPSKTLGVVLEVSLPLNIEVSEADISLLSMQLRQAKVSSIATRDVIVASVMVKEQESALGSFPEPCPIIYTGADYQTAPPGVTAIVVDADKSVPSRYDVDASLGSVSVLRRITCVEDLKVLGEHGQGVWVDAADPSEILTQLSSLENCELVVLAVPSMQVDNAEIHQSKIWAKDFPIINAIAVKEACVGDSEDLAYASFLVDGVTKKKSSTFNMSGITGGVNGHFGGVASTKPVTWLRQKR
jgi:hypothetical protein